MPSQLTWGLTVCTYNRAGFLMQCLKYVLEQTRLPSEVVIVDASDDWEDTYNTVRDTYAEHWQAIKLVYEPAKVRSLTFQRNQALDLSQSDIIFSLDDDIYLFPDAAAIIMKAYEADVDEEIAMIGGHFASHSPSDAEPPREAPGEANHGGSNLPCTSTLLPMIIRFDTTPYRLQFADLRSTRTD